MPASQGGAGRRGGPSWGLSPSSHLPSSALVPAAEPPSAATPCTWLALLGAVHGCSIFLRATSGGSRGALRLAEEPLAILQHPRPRARSPRCVPASLWGAPWGSQAAHPLSILGQSREPGAGGGAPGWGREPWDEIAQGAVEPQPPPSERPEGAACHRARRPAPGAQIVL